MRRQLGAHLEELAYDDDIKVVLLRGEGGVFSTGADMNNAYAWYGDGGQGTGNGPPARASAAGSWSTARRSTSTSSSSATRRSPWPRCPASPSAAASSWRSWPTSSVVARDTAHRHARHPLPRPGARARSTSSSTASARCSPAACCSPATPSRPARSPTSACSPRWSSPTRSTARAAWWAEKASRMPGRRHRPGQGGLPPRRAAVGLPGRGGPQPPAPRLRHQPPVRRGRVQLREGPGRARHQARLRAPRRALRGPRALPPFWWQPVLLDTWLPRRGRQLPPVASTASAATSWAQR